MSASAFPRWQNIRRSAQLSDPSRLDNRDAQIKPVCRETILGDRPTGAIAHA
jgi:hypothetical protein